MSAKKNSTTLSSFAPPTLFLLFDYPGVLLSEHLAFILRDALDTWNRVTYIYADTYIFEGEQFIFAAVHNFVRAVRADKCLRDSLCRAEISQAAQHFLRTDNFNRSGQDCRAADKILGGGFGLSL